MQSNDNQPKQDDESDQGTNTEGLYLHGTLCDVTTLCAWYIWW